MMDPAEKKAMITNITNGIINRLTEADKLQNTFAMDFQTYSLKISKTGSYFLLSTPCGEFHYSATIKGLRKHIRKEVDCVITQKERNHPCD